MRRAGNDWEANFSVMLLEETGIEKEFLAQVILRDGSPAYCIKATESAIACSYDNAWVV